MRISFREIDERASRLADFVKLLDPLDEATKRRIMRGNAATCSMAEPVDRTGTRCAGEVRMRRTIVP